MTRPGAYFLLDLVTQCHSCFSRPHRDQCSWCCTQPLQPHTACVRSSSLFSRCWVLSNLTQRKQSIAQQYLELEALDASWEHSHHIHHHCCQTHSDACWTYACHLCNHTDDQDPISMLWQCETDKQQQDDMITLKTLCGCPCACP